MTKRDDKADSPLRQIKLTTEQQQALKLPLAQLEDQLYQLLARQRLYDYAVHSWVQPEDNENNNESSEAECFAFGVFLYQQQLKQQAEQAMDKLASIKQMIH